MSNSTNFQDYNGNTPIRAAWLNDVNKTVFAALADASGNPPTTAAQVLANLGITNAGVQTWQGRSGTVTMTASDIIGTLGYTPATLASPYFTGIPRADTASPGTNSTQLATTAFVQSAVAVAVAGVSSFNTRTGAVTLTSADVTGALGYTPANGTTTVTNVVGTFTLSNSVNSVIAINDGSYNTGGNNTGAGEMEVWYDFISNGYFSKNVNSHAIAVARCDTANIATAIRGQGLIMGNVNGANGGATHYPTTQIESWFNSTAAPIGNYLPPESDGYASKPLQDNVAYRVVFSSKVTIDGSYYIRYRLYRYNASTYSVPTWQLERDTGDVLDPTNYVDRTKTGLAFEYGFGTPGAPAWTLVFTNVKIIWRPLLQSYNTEVPSWTTPDLSGYATLAGTQTFTGAKAFTAGLSTSLSSVLIGTPSGTFGSMTGWGGGNAKSFTDSTTLAWDAICQVNFIQSFLGASYNAANLEGIIRPLYCVLSEVQALLMARGIY